MEPPFEDVYKSRGNKKAALKATAAAAAAKAKANKNAANAAAVAAAEKYKRNKATAQQKRYDDNLKQLREFYGEEEAEEKITKAMRPGRHTGLLGEPQTYNRMTAVEALMLPMSKNMALASTRPYGGKRRTRRAHKSKRKTRRRS